MGRRRLSCGARVAMALAAALAGVGVSAGAQPDGDEEAVSRPSGAGRLVRVFDFEERGTNPLPIPMGWLRAQHDPRVPRERPGFPLWNGAALDYGVAARGEGSVRLPVSGGSASLRLDPGVVLVFPDADYLVVAQVRTEGVEHARARVSARFLDGEGRPIAASEARSAALSTDGRWERIEVVLPGLHSDAVSLQIDLELLQPREHEPRAHERFEVWPEDFSGSAWFDDVAIIQLPKVELSTASPGNVVAYPESPELTLHVRDLTGERVRSRVAVYDARGRQIDERTDEFGGGRATIPWRPALDGYGWYRAIAELHTEEGRIGSAFVDFAYVEQVLPVAPRYGGRDSAGRRGSTIAGSPDRARFGLTVRELHPLVTHELVELTRRAGTGSISLPLWSADLGVDGLESRLSVVEPLLGALYADWQRLSIVLPVVPEELAASSGVGPEDVAGALASGTAWEPYLADALYRLGQKVQRWELGPPGSEFAALRPGLGEALRAARSGMSRFAAAPALAAGWRADLPASEPLLEQHSGLNALSVLVEPDLPPDAIASLAEGWAAPLAGGADATGRPDLSLVIGTLDGDVYGHRAVADDYVKRAVLFWASFERRTNEYGDARNRLVVEAPWRVVGDRRPRVMPTAALPALRATVGRLADREVVAEWPVAEGVRCYVLAPAPWASSQRGGAIVAWLEQPRERGSVAIEATLGEGAITAFDVYGNASVVEPERSADGLRLVHRVPIGASPTFVEGIDADLVRFLASVRIDPTEVQSAATEREHLVVFNNPWPVGLMGRMIVVSPGGYHGDASVSERQWSITPRTAAFSAAPGERVTIPLSVAMRPTEEAGPVRFVLDFHLRATADYGWVRVASTAELGVTGLELDIVARPAPGPEGPHVVVEAVITNSSDEPITLEASATAPGYPRARTAVTELGPGEQTVRAFPFQDGMQRLHGQRVVVSVSAIDGSARLNKGVSVP
ncbi:hypothetical protein FBT69_09845 [Synechococcales cyanobacterium CNB]|nr:hypothetical protein [Phycisphaerales bacterium]MDL1905095.1 hypothetical protein [Synechococcales cyanobacterium CNB]